MSIYLLRSLYPVFIGCTTHYRMCWYAKYIVIKRNTQNKSQTLGNRSWQALFSLLFFKYVLRSPLAIYGSIMNGSPPSSSLPKLIPSTGKTFIWLSFFIKALSCKTDFTDSKELLSEVQIAGFKKCISPMIVITYTPLLHFRSKATTQSQIIMIMHVVGL